MAETKLQSQAIDTNLRDGWINPQESWAYASASTITVPSGAGGNTDDSGGRRDGGAGSVGRIHLDYSGSYTGTTSPTLNATLDTTIKAGGPNFFAFF